MLDQLGRGVLQVQWVLLEKKEISGSLDLWVLLAAGEPAETLGYRAQRVNLDHQDRQDHPAPLPQQSRTSLSPRVTMMETVTSQRLWNFSRTT